MTFLSLHLQGEILILISPDLTISGWEKTFWENLCLKSAMDVLDINPRRRFSFLLPNKSACKEQGIISKNDQQLTNELGVPMKSFTLSMISLLTGKTSFSWLTPPFEDALMFQRKRSSPHKMNRGF